jgi:pyruvate dehydrogenase E2 component (dihydrolipoamide acetyltransferase)
MPVPIVIPRLGWSMEEGIFAEWLKRDGDAVEPGEMIFVLEGEKAAHEIESFDVGRLCIPADAPQPGTTVKVGECIGFLLATGETPPASVGRTPSSSAAAATPSQPKTSSPAIPRAAGPAARRLARQLGINLQAVATPDPTGRVLCEDVARAAGSLQTSGRVIADSSALVATPRARRRAQELGVDWQSANGTGRGGRVRERDVIAIAAQSRASRTPRQAPAATGHRAANSKLRRTIAQRMLAGVQQTAPVTLTSKVAAGGLVAYRAALKQRTEGLPVSSFNDLLIKLAATALADVPEINACWIDDGVFVYDEINIAVAVDSPAGIVAPVIRNVTALSLAELAERTHAAIDKARSGRLTEQDLAGGTFTITNLGMFDIDAFTPILNLPQAAILGVGRIVQEPVVRGGQLAVDWTVTLSLTIDHRVIDGAPAARWLQGLARSIEQPGLVLDGQ